MGNKHCAIKAYIASSSEIINCWKGIERKKSKSYIQQNKGTVWFSLISPVSTEGNFAVDFSITSWVFMDTDFQTLLMCSTVWIYMQSYL